MRAYVEQVLRTSMWAVVAFMGISSTSQATVWSANWDPKYGFPFVQSMIGFDLGWSGRSEIFVPDGCPTTPGDVLNNAGGCGVATMLLAEVDLFNFVNDAARNTLSFSPAQYTVTRLRYDATNTLIGFEATTPESIFDSFANGDGATNASFSLRFVLDYPYFEGTNSAEYDGPLLLWSREEASCFFVGELCNGVNRLGGEFTPVLRITREAAGVVPEPNGLALVAGALFATAWGVRSRRRNRPNGPEVQ